jgi:hypothetical protein
MVSVQNLHGPTLWGFFFACPPRLSAEIPGLSVDRSRYVSHRCHPFMTAWSHTRAVLLVHDTWAGRRIHATCQGPDLQGQLIPGPSCGDGSVGGDSQHGWGRCMAQGDVTGTDAAGSPLRRAHGPGGSPCAG